MEHCPHTKYPTDLCEPTFHHCGSAVSLPSKVLWPVPIKGSIKNTESFWKLPIVLFTVGSGKWTNQPTKQQTKNLVQIISTEGD